MICWNSSIFTASNIVIESFGIQLTFTSTHSNLSWTLVTVYGPCAGIERDNFLTWLHDLQILDDDLWLLLGDFNFYRSVFNRNKSGADINDIFLFNEVISDLGLVELPIKGKAFTLSNMQQQPLLEQSDWFFTSPSWTLSFPHTLVKPLARSISDHTPCVVQIGTNIPRANVFRFENFWIEHEGFFDLVQSIWDNHGSSHDSAKNISSKLKTLRKGLKKWSKNLSRLQKLISNCNNVISFLDSIEEYRYLSLLEWNFRVFIRSKLLTYLRYKQVYWQKRCTIRWAKFGGENTKFFHAMATESYRKNSIASLIDVDGTIIFDHEGKAHVAWDTFKGRMGVSNFVSMPFDLYSLITPQNGLEVLEAPFPKFEIDNLVKNLPTDRAPGPDGFNGLFMKKCWPIICHDYYNLCQDFHSGSLDLNSLNHSFITLVPKKLTPETINDYRPISLMSISLKFLTKLLADRLQKVILSVIHQN